MISQSTFDNLSNDLEVASQNVIYEFAGALVILIEEVIKDPGNISKAKALFEANINLIIKKFSKASKDWIDNNLSKAYIAGIKEADAELARIGINIAGAGSDITNGSSLINVPAIVPVPEIPGQIILNFKDFEEHTQFFGVFRSAAYYALEDKPLQIMRKSNDIYRDIAVIVGENNFSEADIITRRQISQKFLDEYSSRGLQCITYKNGAVHSIDTYCEMLGRTLTGRCAVQASINRYIQLGYDLVLVSSHFRACHLCTPLEGRILSLSGKDKKYISLVDAINRGLFHPNCLHNITPYFLDVTEIGRPSLDKYESQLVDEYGYEEAQRLSYEAQQRQRYIERQIRKYKRIETTSLDKLSKQKARKKVNEWQSVQRQHIQDNKYLRRKYSREQIKKAY